MVAIREWKGMAAIDDGDSTQESPAQPLLDEVWGAALLAGFLGIVSLLIALGAVNRLVRLPVQSTDDFSQIAFLTLLSWNLMGSVVAGVVEEASFRGYMQGPIERRHGPV